MSLIKNPSELAPKTTIACLIYGQPGIGKTTLACSAPNPVLFDFDGGVTRINGAFQVPTVQVTKWEDVNEALKEMGDQFNSIIIDTALLQQEAVNRVNNRFEKKVKDFANRKEYNKARRTFFKQCEKELSEYFRTEVENIAKRMNDLMPKNK